MTSTAASAPSSSASCRFSSVEAVAMTRAPNALPSWTASEPTPPAAACTTAVSPSRRWAQVRYRCQAVRPWISSASAWPSDTPNGIGKALAFGTAAYSA